MVLLQRRQRRRRDLEHRGMVDQARSVWRRAQNGAYLILDVTVETTKGVVSVNPFYWQAKDAEGRTYDLALGAGTEPALSTAELPAGQKSRGFVALDSPQVPVTVQLVNPGSQVVAAWTVPAK